jgi:glucose-6-phosphate 1-dehydrogenase
MPPNENKGFIVPTVFVLFGITGDLVKRKILPSLYNLYINKLLPDKWQVYGFGRRDWNDEQLRMYLKDLLPEDKIKAEFVKHFFFIQGNFDEPIGYKKLAITLGHVDGQWQVCANKLFYLAVSPEHYKNVLNQLHKSGLTVPCSDEEGWTRVILEKPFGRDMKTAEELDGLLGKLFQEEQIYRVDHYLAKETVRNIIAFRFSNSFLTPGWNNKYIEKIECIFNEKIDVATRGEFYDRVGALRDVGQSHLLQLLALLTMDHPGDFSADSIRQARAKTLNQLEILDKDGVLQNSVRAQYDSYLSEPGVPSNSQTETYFKIKASMHTGPFTSVPIYLSGGKALHEASTEVRVTFKHPHPCLCPPNQHLQNVLHYHINPEESMKIRFLIKKPGYDFSLQEENFGFDYSTTYASDSLVAPYDQLLLDIIKGDQTLFISTEEIMAEWRFVEPIVKHWQKGSAKLLTYPKGDKFAPFLPADTLPALNKQIGIIGLGKMGNNFALQLIEKGWRVVGYNRSPEKTQEMVKYGMVPSFSLAELFSQLSGKPRIVWLMLPSGEVIDEMIFGKGGLVDFMQKGDIILDAGNSYYKDTISRGKKLAKLGIRFADVGFSGGPGGARHGACFMVGGDRKLYDELLPLFVDGATAGGTEHFQGLGAGHFVKMVHNGIEYGMMQAIGEGFAIMKKAPFKLDLIKIANIYNHGSVVESRLIGWLKKGLEEYGKDLTDISSTVSHLGEGAWTVKTAKEFKVAAKVIADSLLFRYQSAKNPSYTGKVVSALRNQFGGHSVAKTKKK